MAHRSLAAILLLFSAADLLHRWVKDPCWHKMLSGNQSHPDKALPQLLPHDSKFVDEVVSALGRAHLGVIGREKGV